MKKIAKIFSAIILAVLLTVININLGVSKNPVYNIDLLGIQMQLAIPSAFASDGEIHCTSQTYSTVVWQSYDNEHPKPPGSNASGYWALVCMTVITCDNGTVQIWTREINNGDVQWCKPGGNIT